MVQKFYFTFGNEGYPYAGGWVEILAESRSEAVKVFRQHYPDRYEGMVNCCDIYSEDSFKKTCMVNGNLGAKCHAVYCQPCKSGDGIDSAVFEAIKAVARKSPDVGWDMSIISEVIDLIEQCLVKRGINTCHL